MFRLGLIRPHDRDKVKKRKSSMKSFNSLDLLCLESSLSAKPLLLNL